MIFIASSEIRVLAFICLEIALGGRPCKGEQKKKQLKGNVACLIPFSTIFSSKHKAKINRLGLEYSFFCKEPQKMHLFSLILCSAYL